MANGKQIIALLGIIGIFTLFDYIAHFFELFMPHIDVLPVGYFLNKIIFGVIALYVLVNVIKIKNEILLSIITAVILQFRYFQTQSYNNMTMIIAHAVFLYAAFYAHRYLARKHENIYPLIIG